MANENSRNMKRVVSGLTALSIVASQAVAMPANVGTGGLFRSIVASAAEPIDISVLENGVGVNSATTSYVYSGVFREVEVNQIIDDPNQSTPINKRLVEGTDYTIKFYKPKPDGGEGWTKDPENEVEQPIAPGMYCYVITGIGEYKGTLEGWYDIDYRELCYYGETDNSVVAGWYDKSTNTVVSEATYSEDLAAPHVYYKSTKGNQTTYTELEQGVDYDIKHYDNEGWSAPYVSTKNGANQFIPEADAKNAGEYSFALYQKEGSNYTVKTNDREYLAVPFKINPADITKLNGYKAPAAVPSLKYDGKKHELITAGQLPEGLPQNIEFKYGQKNDRAQSLPDSSIVEMGSVTNNLVYQLASFDKNGCSGYVDLPKGCSVTFDGNTYTTSADTRISLRIIKENGRRFLRIQYNDASQEAKLRITDEANDSILFSDTKYDLNVPQGTVPNVKSTTVTLVDFDDYEYNWSEDVPTGKDAREYSFYYKVDGGTNYKSVAPTLLTVTIAKADLKEGEDYIVPTLKENLYYTGNEEELVNAGSVAEGKGTLKYAVSTGRVPKVFKTEDFNIYLTNVVELKDVVVGDAFVITGSDGEFILPSKYKYFVCGGSKYERSPTSFNGIRISDYNKTTVMIQYKSGDDWPWLKLGTAGIRISAIDEETGTITFETIDASTYDPYKAVGIEWTESVPTKKELGDYVVSYRIDSTSNYNDVEVHALDVIALDYKATTIQLMPSLNSETDEGKTAVLTYINDEEEEVACTGTEGLYNVNGTKTYYLYCDRSISKDVLKELKAAGVKYSAEEGEAFGETTYNFKYTLKLPTIPGAGNEEFGGYTVSHTNNWVGNVDSDDTTKFYLGEDDFEPVLAAELKVSDKLYFGDDLSAKSIVKIVNDNLESKFTVDAPYFTDESGRPITNVEELVFGQKYKLTVRITTDKDGDPTNGYKGNVSFLEQEVTFSSRPLYEADIYLGKPEDGVKFEKVPVTETDDNGNETIVRYKAVAPAGTFEYNGKEQVPTDITVVNPGNGEILKVGEIYTENSSTVKNSKNAGTYSYKLTAIDNPCYSEDVDIEWTIEKADISKYVNVKAKDNIVYDGSEIDISDFTAEVSGENEEMRALAKEFVSEFNSKAAGTGGTVKGVKYVPRNLIEYSYTGANERITSSNCNTFAGKVINGNITVKKESIDTLVKLYDAQNVTINHYGTPAKHIPLDQYLEDDFVLTFEDGKLSWTNANYPDETIVVEAAEGYRLAFDEVKVDLVEGSYDIPYELKFKAVPIYEYETEEADSDLVNADEVNLQRVNVTLYSNNFKDIEAEGVAYSIKRRDVTITPSAKNEMQYLTDTMPEIEYDTEFAKPDSDTGVLADDLAEFKDPLSVGNRKATTLFENNKDKYGNYVNPVGEYDYAIDNTLNPNYNVKLAENSAKFKVTPADIKEAGLIFEIEPSTPSNWYENSAFHYLFDGTTKSVKVKRVYKPMADDPTEAQYTLKAYNAADKTGDYIVLDTTVALFPGIYYVNVKGVGNYTGVLGAPAVITTGTTETETPKSSTSWAIDALDLNASFSVVESYDYNGYTPEEYEIPNDSSEPEADSKPAMSWTVSGDNKETFDELYDDFEPEYNYYDATDIVVGENAQDEDILKAIEESGKAALDKAPSDSGEYFAVATFKADGFTFDRKEELKLVGKFKINPSDNVLNFKLTKTYGEVKYGEAVADAAEINKAAGADVSKKLLNAASEKGLIFLGNVSEGSTKGTVYLSSGDVIVDDTKETGYADVNDANASYRLKFSDDAKIYKTEVDISNYQLGVFDFSEENLEEVAEADLPKNVRFGLDASVTVTKRRLTADLFTARTLTVRDGAAIPANNISVAEGCEFLTAADYTILNGKDGASEGTYPVTISANSNSKNFKGFCKVNVEIVVPAKVTATAIDTTVKESNPGVNYVRYQFDREIAEDAEITAAGYVYISKTVDELTAETEGAQMKIVETSNRSGFVRISVPDTGEGTTAVGFVVVDGVYVYSKVESKTYTEVRRGELEGKVKVINSEIDTVVKNDKNCVRYKFDRVIPDDAKISAAGYVYISKKVDDLTVETEGAQKKIVETSNRSGFVRISVPDTGDGTTAVGFVVVDGIYFYSDVVSKTYAEVKANESNQEP